MDCFINTYVKENIFMEIEFYVYIPLPSLSFSKTTIDILSASVRLKLDYALKMEIENLNLINEDKKILALLL